MRNPVARLLATTALSAPLALVPLASHGAEIGTVAAVNPSMAGTPPTAERRTLTLGQKLIQNERVETSQDGSGQLLFLDQTTLTVAPQSELVLDKYVYDPEQESGEVALTMTKGVLRFIGGRITKKTEAIIRTPAATVGIRGGLALVIVDSGGQTRVCHLAGEYTQVNSNDTGAVTLSRPNACAVVAGGQATFGGLISNAELQEFYEQLEGGGSGGTTNAEAVVDSAQVASVNSDAKAGERNEPVSTSGESSPDDESANDELRPRQDEVETPTQIALAPPEGPEIVDPPIDPELPPVDPGLQPLVVNTLGGSAFQSPSNTATPFSSVDFGSLIGTSDAGSLTIPVPGTGTTPEGFDTALILSNLGNPEFSALDNEPTSGLFRFGSGQGNSSELGPISGVGFLDPAASFAFVEFENVGNEGEPGGDGGFAVFGIAAEFQRQFFEDDGQFSVDTFGEADGTQFEDDGTPVDPIILNIAQQEIFPDFPTGTTFFASAGEPADTSINTVEVFEVQPNLLFDDLDAPVGAQLLMIGNQGMARFERDSVTFDERTSAGGGKWLAGSLQIENDPFSGRQTSSMTVLADDVKSFGDSGPILATTGVGTFYNNEASETFDFQSIEAIRQTFGTFEDADGATLFGQVDSSDEGQYLVLSSVSRGGLVSGDTLPPEPAFDPGEVVELFQRDGDPSIGEGAFVHDRIDDEATAFVNLLAINDDLSERVLKPLPLAGERTQSGYDTPLNLFDRGFVSGVARCETGQCGDRVDGSYAIQTNNADSFSIQFDQAQEIFLPDGSSSFEIAIDNEFSFAFEGRSEEAGAIADTLVDEQRIAVFQFSGNPDTSAYADDNRFGATVVDGAGGADVAIASAGLIGDGGIFPQGVDTTPEFVRWGWWSATLNPTLEDGSTRTDIVHLGNFVTGVRPDDFVDDVPAGFTARYDGFAVGTTQNTFTGATRIVGGSFGLTYDFGGFGGDKGIATLSIPDANLDEVIPVRAGANGLTFSGFAENFSTVTETTISGGFFSDGTGATPGGAVAGVGGEFSADALEFGTRTVGVFGGDRTSLTPLVGGEVTDITDIAVDTGGQVINRPGVPQP